MKANLTQVRLAEKLGIHAA
ncbi:MULTISPECIES: hypothetical protein [Desulfotignum]